MSETLSARRPLDALLSDEQLVILCQQKWPCWEASFAILYRRYQQPVYQACLRYLRHEADASDAAQAVFVRVWRHLTTFKGRSRFSTWLYRIVRNQCYSAAAARSPVTDTIDAWAARLVALEDGIDAPERQETVARIRLALARLLPGAEYSMALVGYSLA